MEEHFAKRWVVKQNLNLIDSLYIYRRLSLPKPATATSTTESPAATSSSVVESIKRNFETSFTQLREDLMTNSKNDKDMTRLMREVMACKVCYNIPTGDSVQVAGCCGTIMGCGVCATRFFTDKQSTPGCMFCNNLAVRSKTFELRGFNEVLAKLREEDE